MPRVNPFRLRNLAICGLVLSAALLLVAATAGADAPQPGLATPASSVEGLTASPPVLNYQGRLVDPSTGNPKNGTFQMTFGLYDVALSGTALWTETKNVGVTNGLFNTLLGDITALNLSLFDGRDLWLGVRVSTDMEATPRIPVSYAPYALYAANANMLDGLHSNVFANAIHQHAAGDITSGFLSTDRYVAMDDLVASGNIGMGMGQLAPGDHGHFSAAWQGNSAAWGLVVQNDGTGDGIRATSNSTGYNWGAIYAINGSTGSGVYASSAGGTGVYAEGADKGVYGHSTGTGTGVYGMTDATSGNAIWGYASGSGGASQIAVGAGTDSASSYAGYFIGQVHVSGNLTVGGAKAFRIDHPLDPANKYLYHFAVEAPEVRNQYEGIAVLGANGEATVALPDYFDALNLAGSYRYQLTCVGGYAPVYIAQEISGSQFVIGGGKPGLKVSWQVTAVRNDPYVRDHPVQAEADKSPEEKGTYQYPEGYGQPETAGQDYDRMPPVQAQESNK